MLKKGTRKIIILALLIIGICWNLSAEIPDVFCTQSLDSIVSKYQASILDMQGEQLMGDIYHYTLTLQVGKTEYDKIRLHRVVKADGTSIARSNSEGIMLVHGGLSDFTTAFLPSTLTDAIPEGHSLALYLAEQNIDVWGIDLRSTFVPDGTTDFGFMKDWNIGSDIQDIELVLIIARFVRMLNGTGYDRLILAGHSMGAFLCYAYANYEAVKPIYLTQVKGIIPMEIVYKYDPQYQDLIDASFIRYQALKAAYDSGIYHNEDGAQMKMLGLLARMMPDDPSPVMPWLTNRQTFLLICSASYALSQPPFQPYTPFYHYFRGVFDGNMLPIDLAETDTEAALDIIASIPPYMTMAEFVDIEGTWTNIIDTPYDDNLAQIKIPVYYIGAAGGFGAYGVYSTTILGSNDIQHLIVSLLPQGFEALDFGHIDLLTASSADVLVWQPMVNWINQH